MAVLRTNRQCALVPLAFIMANPSLLCDTWQTPPASRIVVSIDGSAKVVEASSGNDGQRSIKVYRSPAPEQENLYWTANLMNCPVKIFVAPAGERIVTMDKWGTTGSDALIFYRREGTVLKRYPIAQELLTEGEISRIQRSVSSFLWSDDAHAEFTRDGSYFWMWLPSGRVMMFDATTGNSVDASAIRVDLNRGRPIVLATAELLSQSPDHVKRIAAARLAGWLSGVAAAPVLRALLADPYHQLTGQYTNAEDRWNRYAGSPFQLFRRVYPVRRAAAEELHIQFGQALGVVEELVAH